MERSLAERMGRAAFTGVEAFLAARAGLRRLRAYELRDKVVLITGGSRGLGLELARQFAARGARLALCARDAAELERARDELSRVAQVWTYQCDVGDPMAVEGMVARIAAEAGAVDVLVNNAGVIQMGPFELMTLQDFEEAMRVHFWGPLRLVQAVLPAMKARGSGRIVNISSVGGKISVPHLLPYCASKFALTGLSEGLRAELIRDGIKVTTVTPWLMRTGSPPNAYFKGHQRQEYAWFTIPDSLPLLSMNARRAAWRIVQACRFGTAEVSLSPQSKVATWINGRFAGLVSDAMGLVNLMLPGPGGAGIARTRGRNAESGWTTSPLTFLTRRAAARNNELG